MKLSAFALSLVATALGFAPAASLSAQVLEKPVVEKPVVEKPAPVIARRIKGTKVSLVLPKGFGAADRFPGFMNPSLGSSVMVTEFAGPYAKCVAGFGDTKRLAANKMTVNSRVFRKQGGNDGLLMQIDQDTEHIRVRKWIWVFGNEKQSVIVMGTCMKNHASEQLPILREAVTSARWDLAAQVDVFEGLPFRLADTSGLVYANRVGQTLYFTVDGKPDLARENKAMLIVGPSISKVEISDKRAYALQRVEWLPYAYAKISAPEAVEIDGMKGFVMRGEGQDKAKKKVAIYGVVLFEGEGYWMIHGAVKAEQREQFMPIFERMAASLRRVRRPGTTK